VDILTPLGALVAFFWGIWQHFHSKSLQVFEKYCKKYNAIVTPDILERWNNALSNWPPKEVDSERCLERAMLSYLNLVWEEFYLHDEGLIRKGTWKAWRSGIDQTMHTTFARDVLRKHRKHFSEFDMGSQYHPIADELGIKSL
jgi:hypothetical protein